ncbi:MAG: NAD(P)-dependent oxidoreductase [Candidatus Thermoplasmatota archaeon]|jgi:UDP-glucose 4-epimerase|nr:NAD(P)-dependent oxidoreductase [Candidatus Thermoplasmatota archaeon]MCL5984389.1 NAD(P)-dependent oxidoreductase [Candidatus Thermoplasmatota archaeon]
MPIVGITGATGYVGGRLVQLLSQRQTDLRLLDDGSGPVHAINPGIEVLSADFASAEGLRWVSDCDVVVHLAALSGVVACARDPAGSRAVNVAGTSRLVEQCRSRRIPLVFASSFSVVGIPERLPITEETPARPTHEYSQQKAEGERLVRQLSHDGGALGVILRMSNLYGNYLCQGTPVGKGNVLNLFAGQARKGGPLQVFAPGTQKRDFIHIEDVVRHWLAAVDYLLRPRPPEVPTFSVASGEAWTVLGVAGLVTEIWKELHPRDTPLSVSVVENPRADVEILHPEFEVDPSYTRKALGVECRISLRDGIRTVLSGT